MERLGRQRRYHRHLNDVAWASFCDGNDGQIERSMFPLKSSAVYTEARSVYPRSDEATAKGREGEAPWQQFVLAPRPTVVNQIKIGEPICIRHCQGTLMEPLTQQSPAFEPPACTGQQHDGIISQPANSACFHLNSC